jgi:hypothetical protein
VNNTLNLITKKPLFLLAILLVITAKGHLEIIDTEYSVRTAIGIIEDGSMLIEPVDQRVVDRFPKIEGTDKIYSQYGIGLAIIFIPAVILGKFAALFTNIDQRVFIDFILSFYNIPFALLGLYFFRSILLHDTFVYLYWLLEIFCNRFFRNHSNLLFIRSSKLFAFKEPE